MMFPHSNTDASWKTTFELPTWFKNTNNTILTFLQTDYMTDVEFLCKDGRKVGAHAIIISNASPFLARLFKSDPKILHSGEKIIVSVPDLDAGDLKLLIQSIYLYAVPREVKKQKVCDDLADFLRLFDNKVTDQDNENEASRLRNELEEDDRDVSS